MSNEPTAPVPPFPVTPGNDFPHEPDERTPTNPSGNPLPDTPQALNPSDSMLGGDSKTTDLQSTVDSRRLGSSETNEDTERPKNRMVAENQLDYDELSDTGPRRQGNSYGDFPDSLRNFAADARNEAEILRQRAEEKDKEAEDFERRADEKEQEQAENTTAGEQQVKVNEAVEEESVDHTTITE